ncbi:MAG TPA: hypothetical protein VEV39_09560 [Gemmatimonadales bacterium]|nr:hypothetical protein [Gemmatimonadales bacterium]
MNPLLVLPFLAYTVAAVLWPGQVSARRRGAALLGLEAVAIAVFCVAGWLLSRLATPSSDGWRWGAVMLLATGYLYVCGRGMALVRAVLDLPDLLMPREDDRAVGGVEVTRGRAIGVLERAIALTLVLLSQYGALGLVVAAKSLARFKALEDRDFAEYFLIGTLASLLIAVLGGVAMRALMRL